MKLKKQFFNGKVWPLEVHCEDPYGGHAFLLELPKDLYAKKLYSRTAEFDSFGEPVIESNIHYYCECPVCGRIHEISAENIPPVIKEHINIQR